MWWANVLGSVTGMSDSATECKLTNALSNSHSVAGSAILLTPRHYYYHIEPTHGR